MSAHKAVTLAATLLCLALGCGPSEPAPGAARNIVLILSDDVGVGDLGGLGNDLVDTPELDALAAEGITFSHAFTPVTVCIPSRGALMTGLYPQTTGMMGFGAMGIPPDDVETLPELLARIGYRNGEIGKSALVTRERYPFEFRHHTISRAPARYRQLVRGFLAADDGRPFFLLVSLRDAHRPFPKRGAASKQRTLDAVRVPATLFDTPEIRHDLARYYDALERMDSSIGAVLDELDEAGQADSTLVIYSSDHGPSFPYAKGMLYDGGVRVPLLVRWPGQLSPGARSDAMISLIDVMPTLLDAIGRPDLIASDLDGRSFVPVLRNPATEHREIIFGGVDRLVRGSFPSRMARTRSHKYIYTVPTSRPFGGELTSNETWWSMLALSSTNAEAAARVSKLNERPLEELYDLRADPAELESLVDDPEQAAIRARLVRELHAWMEGTGDELELPREVTDSS